MARRVTLGKLEPACPTRIQLLTFLVRNFPVLSSKRLLGRFRAERGLTLRTGTEERVRVCVVMSHCVCMYPALRLYVSRS